MVAAPLPPWLLLAGLLGVINAAACFLLFGRHWSRLAWYAVLGIFAASLAQVVGFAVPLPKPLLIGEVNVALTTLATFGVLGFARLSGL